MENLGAIQSKPDKRDILLAETQAPTSFPLVYSSPVSDIPVYFQNGIGSCTAHAGALGASIFEKIENNSVKPLSPRFLYAQCKKDDGVPEENQGTYLRQVLKKLSTVGICENSYFPNDVSLPYLTYKDYRLIPAEAFSNAENYQIGSYAFLDNLSFENIKRAIYKNKWVLLMISVGNEYFAGDKAVPPSNVISGHLICCFGYDNDKIYYRDSIRTNNNQRYLCEDYLPFVKEGGTAIDIPNWTVEVLKKKILILRQIVQLYLKLLDLTKKGR